MLGECRRGPACHFLHDPSKVAICKEYLFRGTCSHGSSCNLSHDPTPQRVPACLHFTRGNCTNDNCRYAHVKVNQNAPICGNFARLGYCEAGGQCVHRHETECPDYANHGRCADPKCRLPHVDRAGQLRVLSAGTVTTANPTDENSKLTNSSTLDNQHSAPDDEMLHHPRPGSVFSQEHNFLSLDDDPDGTFEQRFS